MVVKWPHMAFLEVPLSFFSSFLEIANVYETKMCSKKKKKTFWPDYIKMCKICLKVDR